MVTGGVSGRPESLFNILKYPAPGAVCAQAKEE
jgi:hypothetical protein